MKQQNTILTAAQFLAALEKEDAFSSLRHQTTIVTGITHINGKEIKINSGQGQQPTKSLRLENITFLERVTIEHFSSLLFCADSINFRGGISFCNCTGSWISIRDCRMADFDGYHNKFEVLLFQEIEGEPADRPEWTKHPLIDISGFTLEQKLVFEKVQARDLRTLSDRVEGRFASPAAVADDPLWALQLRLSGINVHVSTEVAKKMLEPSSYAERVSAAA